MSSVININRWDQARFEKFAEESSAAFEDFMIKGHAYTPIKAYIYTKGKIVNTDVLDSLYEDTLNVINYYNPSFRSVFPNMDGAMHSHSHTYGLFFMSFITGFHNIQVYKCFGQCSKISVHLDHMSGSGVNGNLLTLQATSKFNNAYIVGFSKDSNIVNLAVRYSDHKFFHYKLSANKGSRGCDSTEVDYKNMTSWNGK